MNLHKHHFDAIARQSLDAMTQLARSMGYLSIDESVSWDCIEMQVWQQEWPTAGCGHPGDHYTPSRTIADTVVFKDLESGVVCVTHNHKIAYLVQRPSSKYYEHFRDRWLVGKTDYRGQYSEE
jgi:hypothetical protein